MTMTKKLIAGVIFLALAGAAAFGYEYYQWHHLSAELKRSLTAALDQSASRDDVRVYNRDARLQVRTQRDATVLAHFERLVSLSDALQEGHVRKDREWRDSLSSMASGGHGKEYAQFDELIKLRSQYWERHLKPPASLDKDLREALDQAKQQIDQQKRDEDAADKLLADQEAAAKQLYGEMRRDLSLPAVTGEK